MIGKCCVAAALLFAGTAAAQTSTTLDVPIVVTHGAPLTTFTFVNNSGKTLPAGSPVSFGQAFRYGDVMPGNHPVIRDAATHVPLAGQQWDEISTWRENGGNGSWRHAVWAIDLPNSLAAGATYQVEFVVGAGAYWQSPVLALSALCSGPNSHDLKIHLTDVRNQDDTVRRSGDATLNLCDNIANTGRDAPRILDQGSVVTTAKILGRFLYTDATYDPLLYAECNLGLWVDPATGNSLKDTQWVCWVHNGWQTVAAGTTGHAGNPGPAGLTNDPQAISYRPEVDDGSTDVLDWSALDATVASASNPIQTSGCGVDFTAAANLITACLNIPSSTGPNAWYFGQAVRITSTGTPVGGLTNGALEWVFNNGSTNNACSDQNIVSIEDAVSPQGGSSVQQILTSSQGSGNTTFAFRVWHTVRQSWLTLNTTMDDNWSPGGSATRVTREVLPSFTNAEKLYWEETGLVTPINTGQPDPGVTLNCAYGQDANYHPFARGDIIGGNGVGNRPDLGFPNDYAAQAWVINTPAYWSLARLFSIGEAASPFGVMLNEGTGRIMVFNNGPPDGPGGNGVGGAYPQLGIGYPMFDVIYPSQANPTDVAPALQGVPNANTDWRGGWWGAYTNGEPSHQANFQGFTYLVFGSRHWLDMIYYQSNRTDAYVEYGPGFGYRDDNLGGTSYHYYGLSLFNQQSRGSAREIWDKVLAAAAGGDNNEERTYNNDRITEMGNYYPRWLQYADGPGNSNLLTGITAPNFTGSGYAQDIFIENYTLATTWALVTHLHAPMGVLWTPQWQSLYEGTVGEQMWGHLNGYYSIDYTRSEAVHNADQQLVGGSIGQWFNGVDASDYGGYDSFTSILSGGQMQEPSYHLAQGGTVKWSNGTAGQHNGLLDQMPGNQWFTVMNADDSTGTFYVQCPVGHAVDATCPTPGQPFVGFTRGGVPVAPETGDNAYYRPLYDPGPGGGFADVNYSGYAEMNLNLLQVLGFDVSHAQTDLATRYGPYPLPYEPYMWLDPTVAAPGLPAVVTYGNEFPVLSCASAPGTVMSSLGLIQGNGNAPSGWTILPTNSDTTHFAISGNNLVTAGSLPCNASQAIQVQTTQTGGGTVTGQINLHIGP